MSWQQQLEASSLPSTSSDSQLNLTMTAAELTLQGGFKSATQAQMSSLSALPVARPDILGPDTVQDADPGDADDSESDDDGIDKYRLPVNSQVDRLPTATRRRGDAAFQTWIQESQRSNTRVAADASTRAVDRLSTARLIQSNEDRKIIVSPREYQIDLFERAKEKNIIIVLDTGSGKTLIAALLLRHTLDQELERRAVGESRKVAFFLVEKVALCFQQYSVLKANLEHPVAKFHGEMAGVMRTKEFWDEQLASNMVFVCTAQILLDCLNNGFLRINQVNLLIFDEAHHTKKNHPYARIIKDHYLREPAVNRPRILGMTASPVDAQTRDLRASAVELETILCSEIATVSDEVLIESQARRRQIEIKEYYDRLLGPKDARTPLWKQIESLLFDDALYRVHFEATQEAASTLGPWCADRYWELLITDEEVIKRTAKAETVSSGMFAPDGSSEADRVLAAMRQAQSFIRNYDPLKTPTRDSLACFSSKFRTLRQILDEAFSNQNAQRCIVFVQKRYTALLLADAFQHVDQRISEIRPSYLVGSQALSSSIANMSFRDQVLTLVRFKRGEINCLFATQVAEEGIDIPECDFIIRFDLYDSAIQYIQSKGRARQAQSTYISMLEQGNMHHLRRLKQATRDANALRRFCSALPADRKIQDDIDLSLATDNERVAQRVYEIEETGARLTFVSSLEVLAKFVSSLSSDAVVEYVVTFAYTRKRFLATVILPDSSPIKSINGHPQRNKQLARCSAAFEACVELIKKKYINNHLQPTLSKRLPAMRNARLALSSNKKESYPMRVKSDMWSQLGPQAPTELFEAVLILDSPVAVGRPISPMVLLTRRPLPAFKPTMLYFDKGNTSAMRLLPSQLSLKVSPGQVDALTDFTLTVFADIFSKEYDAEPEDIPYFLAPAVALDAGESILANGAARVDWELLKVLAQSEPPSWRGAPENFFDNKLVMDPWDGSRKFIIHGINKNIKPHDPVPPGAPLPKSRSYRLSDQTIAEYSNSLTIKSRKRQQWSDDQPVVNAELLPLRRNFLDEYNVDQTQDMRCWLILEPLRISKLPINVVSMALIVPVMMYRLDSELIALEACSLLDLDIRPDMALEALTKDSSNSEAHGQEQVDFQVGMGSNYERLEFLGDAFLKMATTISLFTLNPNSDEFECHVERMILICNKNLFNHAVDRKIQEYVRSKSFDRRTWYPNLRLKKGKMPKTEVWHSLSDKSVADVCEALIGAAYMSGAEEGDMDLAVKAVTKMMPAWQSAPASAAPRAAVVAIEKATGYRFQWPNLLRSAFKHPSYPYEAIPSYQRLEFLGDALLDLVIVDYLFQRFPDADPQWMTEHKMAMTSNHFFGCLCVQIGLQRHLLMTTSSLVGQLSEFVEELERAKEAAVLEAQASGAEARRDFWLTTSHPPKALSDMLEALVGAMFVDSGYDYGVVRRFFATLIEPYFEDMALYDTYTSKHPVTALTHLLQEQLGCHSWRLYVSAVPCTVDQGAAAMMDDDVVCALMVHEQVVEHAAGKTGRDAKLLVAKTVVRRLEGVDRAGYREMMGCNCCGSAGEPEGESG
ncbi:ribonuclease III domain-containing protein [Hirsutella rhossiliensis]|uniref:Dicer-like protein 1 n=1 Tax=Hirsutella rhossiliensis TaxID=111463 RepID=A0A9P8MVD9_9HYPO|nr:ribonuclease III domain-containing protein [Hirsutella rhossiliensis]KAH0961124.1 ribonuclease III domain-containing protein [Hirsutella rhossiliensis]